LLTRNVEWIESIHNLLETVLMVWSNKMTYFTIAMLVTLVIVSQLFWFGESRAKKPKGTVAPKAVTYQCGTLRKTPPEQFVQGIKFRLYVISHDDKSYDIAQQWTQCKPWATVVRIPTSLFFESIVYKEILPQLTSEWEGLDFVGIATYRSLKFSPMEKMKAYLELGFHKPYDVVPLYTAGEHMMQQAVDGHSNQFMHVWDNLLQAMGYTQPQIRSADHAEVFFRNSILIRPAWLKKLSHFMISAMDVVQNNATVRAEFATDAKYKEAIYRKAVAQRVFQTDYYQWHPFIFERLPVFYLHHHNASVYGALRQMEWFDFANSEQVFKGL